MSKNKLWMYPYDKVYMKLLKYSDRISKYRIVGKCDYQDKNICEAGGDASFLCKRADQFDGILLPDLTKYSLSDIDHICTVCHRLITKGKYIIAVNNKIKINGAIYLNQEDLVSNRQIHFPVVALLKVEDSIDSFSLSLELKAILETRNVKTAVLSNFPYAPLFDDYIMIPDFMYFPISTEEKVKNITSYVTSSFNNRNYDVMLLDCPVGLMTSTPANQINFFNLELLKAFPPDYTLVQLLAEEYTNMAAIGSILERKCGEKIDAWIMSNLFYDRPMYLDHEKVQHFTFSENTINRLVRKIESSEKPVFSVNAIPKICDDILEHISYDLDDCRKVEL